MLSLKKKALFRGVYRTSIQSKEIEHEPPKEDAQLYLLHEAGNFLFNMPKGLLLLRDPLLQSLMICSTTLALEISEYLPAN